MPNTEKRDLATHDYLILWYTYIIVIQLESTFIILDKKQYEDASVTEIGMELSSRAFDV